MRLIEENELQWGKNKNGFDCQKQTDCCSMKWKNDLEGLWPGRKHNMGLSKSSGSREDVKKGTELEPMPQIINPGDPFRKSNGIL